VLFGNLQKGSFIHIIAWSGHKSGTPLKSIGAAETLAAGEAIDEAKVLANAFSSLLGLAVVLGIVVASKELYSTLSTCRNAADRSSRVLLRYIHCVRRDRHSVLI